MAGRRGGNRVGGNSGGEGGEVVREEIRGGVIVRGLNVNLFLTADMSFNYEGQPLLFKNTDFGIDMQSRGMCVYVCW